MWLRIDSLINFVRKLGEKETVVIAGHLNDHVGVNQRRI